MQTAILTRILQSLVGADARRVTASPQSLPLFGDKGENGQNRFGPPVAF